MRPSKIKRITDKSILFAILSILVIAMVFYLFPKNCLDQKIEERFSLIGERNNVFEERSSLVLDKSEEWLTIGDTRIYSFHIADADADNSTEIITAGYALDDFQTPATYNGQLRIWNWNDTTLTLENSVEWNGTKQDIGDTQVFSVFVADVDNNSAMEIVTAGFVNDGTRDNGQLRIWNGATLSLEDEYIWYTTSDTCARGLYIYDVDEDDTLEIVTTGYAYDGSTYNAQMCIFNWDGHKITLEKEELWFTEGTITGETLSFSVYAGDVDNDDFPEITTAGYTNIDNRDNAQLRVWTWDSSTLTLEHSEEWHTVDRTKAYSVYGSDVDMDGICEIVTGGFAKDQTIKNAQLRIWNWNGAVLELEKTKEWNTTSNTQLWSVFVYDVDNDNIPEIISGGQANDNTQDNAQLRVWDWNNSSLSMNTSKEWYTNDTAIYSVYAEDVDNDDVVEILSGGHAEMTVEDHAQLRIWHLSTGIAPPMNVDARLEGVNFEDVNITWTLSEDDSGLENYAIYYNLSYNSSGVGYSFLGQVPSGNSYFIHENTGDGNTTDCFYYIQANGTSGENARNETQVAKFVREMPYYPSKPRQLISIPLVQSDTTLTTVLQTIEGNYSYVQWYDPLDTIDHWITYSILKPSGFSDLLNINHTIGLWVTMTANDNLTVAGKVPESTSIQLYKGWNFVSYASFIDRNVSEALTDTLYNQVEGFNESASLYHLRILNDEDIMNAGNSYWIYVISDCVWTIYN